MEANKENRSAIMAAMNEKFKEKVNMIQCVIIMCVLILKDKKYTFVFRTRSQKRFEKTGKAERSVLTTETYDDRGFRWRFFFYISKDVFFYCRPDISSSPLLDCDAWNKVLEVLSCDHIQETKKHFWGITVIMHHYLFSCAALSLCCQRVHYLVGNHV